MGHVGREGGKLVAGMGKLRFYIGVIAEEQKRLQGKWLFHLRVLPRAYPEPASNDELD